MKNSEVEQVKGVTYSLANFLGPQKRQGGGKILNAPEPVQMLASGWPPASVDAWGLAGA